MHNLHVACMVRFIRLLHSTHTHKSLKEQFQVLRETREDVTWLRCCCIWHVAFGDCAPFETYVFPSIRTHVRPRQWMMQSWPGRSAEQCYHQSPIWLLLCEKRSAEGEINLCCQRHQQLSKSYFFASHRWKWQERIPLVCRWILKAAIKIWQRTPCAIRVSSHRGIESLAAIKKFHLAMFHSQLTARMSWDAL